MYKRQTLTFALAGNQNCGKTTLFNQLTGSNQHVGNFPGVTVDRKSGAIKGHPETEVTDLPGIYSMSVSYTHLDVYKRQLMYFTGLDLNVMTLAGLSLGICMLVDNSVVVIENVYRLRSRGVPAARAAVQGLSLIHI